MSEPKKTTETFHFVVTYRPWDQFDDCGDDWSTRRVKAKGECEHDARRKVLNRFLEDGYQVREIHANMAGA